MNRNERGVNDMCNIKEIVFEIGTKQTQYY